MTAETPDPELVREAAKFVIATRITTITALQGRFHIGYDKAAQLMQVLEDHEIVGSRETKRARPLLVPRRQLREVLASLPGGGQ